MTLDFSNVGLWLQAANTLAIVVLWLRRPGVDAMRHIEQLKVVQGEVSLQLKGRIDVLEERVKHMPTDEEVRALMTELGEIKAEMSGVKAGVDSMKGAVGRIEHYLLNERHK